MRGGRQVLDQPPDPPEGTVVELIPTDTGGDLDEEERRRRVAAIERGLDEAEAGDTFPAEEILAALGISARS